MVVLQKDLPKTLILKSFFMNIYLIIHTSGQTVAKAEAIENLQFKYPETVVAIINLEYEVIQAIKNDDIIDEGHFA